MPSEKLEGAAWELAENILSCNQTAVRKTKQLIDKGMKELEEGLMFERREAMNFHQRLEMDDVKQRMPGIQEWGKNQTVTK